MLEVFPKQVNQQKLEANLSKLASAFLMVAEDLMEEEENNEGDFKTENPALTNPLTLSCKSPK